jgi:hypothetical protein
MARNERRRAGIDRSKIDLVFSDLTDEKADVSSVDAVHAAIRAAGSIEAFIAALQVAAIDMEFHHIENGFNEADSRKWEEFSGVMIRGFATSGERKGRRANETA